MNFVLTFFCYIFGYLPLQHLSMGHNEVLGQCVDPNPLPEGMEKSKPETKILNFKKVKTIEKMKQVFTFLHFLSEYFFGEKRVT